MDVLKGFLFVVGVFSVIFFSVVGINRHVNSHRVIVKNGQETIYDGEYACVLFKTAGAATHVKIFEMPLCVTIKENIVSNSIYTIKGE